MSLGNKKKVGIVQGLLHSPKLIILDEPTSGLDPLMQRAFFDLIKRENEGGATVLFSSHILSEVQRICDRVAIIREGRIISVQRIAELRRNACKKVSFTARRPLSGFDMEGASGVGVDGAHVGFMYRAISTRWSQSSPPVSNQPRHNRTGTGGNFSELLFQSGVRRVKRHEYISV
jgi:ABC-2 type transport system ATP-binding protein